MLRLILVKKRQDIQTPLIGVFSPFEIALQKTINKVQHTNFFEHRIGYFRLSDKTARLN
uniref:hypothetical protein n=1 Tax=Psychrobacter nivimaris TaxID=281738 RepID=UPI003735D6F4